MVETAVEILACACVCVYVRGGEAQASGLRDRMREGPGCQNSRGGGRYVRVCVCGGEGGDGGPGGLRNRMKQEMGGGGFILTVGEQ